MKHRTTIRSVAALLVLVSVQAEAGGFSEKGAGSVAAVSKGGVALSGLASRVVAVPLNVAGEIGNGFETGGQELLDLSRRPLGTPLPITLPTGEVIEPPAQALEQQVR